MKAGEQKLTRFFQNQDTQFVIPVYQRNYDWESGSNNSQCKQLLDDILHIGQNDNKTSHFIGSIVYIHDDVYHHASTKTLTIIDGQQRITTLTLLLSALHHKAKKSNNQRLAEQIYNQYLINPYADNDNEKIKLKPTSNNRNALKFLLDYGNEREFGEYSRLIENYNYFFDRINIENIDIINQGLNKLIYVDIALERGKDEPQRIFESLNSTGLELSQGDLIRNYILMELVPKKQEQIYSKYWQPIELLTTKIGSNKNRTSDFIRHFLTVKSRKIPPKAKVYQIFKSEHVLNEIDLETTLNELLEFASYYGHLINPDNEISRKIRTQIKYINKIEINVSYPFLLEVYRDYKSKTIDENTFIKVLELIQSFVWRRFIIGLPTNALNKIFMTLYRSIKVEEYIESLEKALKKKGGIQRFPNDDEVINELKIKNMYKIQGKNKTYFLERLENHKNKEPVLISDNEDITVEHIFPQKPSKWESTLSREDFRLLNDVYLHTISNLTLSGNNGSLGNKPFLEKRDLPEKGYKDSRLFLNRYLSTIDEWNIEKLNLRFEIITQRFKEIWKYPKVMIDTELSEEVNIFEAEDPTNKKLEYVRFDNKKIKVKHYKDLYKKIITELYDLQKSYFFTTDLGERLKLSKNAHERGVVEIKDGYYIEAWLSSKEIFKRIKYALEVYDFSDELYIKYDSR
jgi:uncharacterized protein with ParB-like and HNH nuclease domain